MNFIHNCNCCNEKFENINLFLSHYEDCYTTKINNLLFEFDKTLSSIKDDYNKTLNNMKGVNILKQLCKKCKNKKSDEEFILDIEDFC